jgi:WD40 repeat protein
VCYNAVTTLSHCIACTMLCCCALQDVKSIAWHPSKELLASCSYDNSIKLWTNDEADWLCVQTLEGEHVCRCSLYGSTKSSRKAAAISVQSPVGCV